MHANRAGACDFGSNPFEMAEALLASTSAAGHYPAP